MKNQIFALNLSRIQATAIPIRVSKGLGSSRHFPSFKKLLPGTLAPPKHHIQQPKMKDSKGKRRGKEEERKRRKKSN